MTRKLPKLFHGEEERENDEQQQQLIPGLPDHIAHLSLSKIHPSILYSVSLSWRRFIYSPLFPPFLSLYALLIPNSTTNSQFATTPIEFSCFDPVSAQWQSLPPPPDAPLRLLLRHPSFISRNLPIQSIAAGGRLAVVAASNHHLLPALRRPLVFDPLAGSWAYGPEIPVPRRWCAAGALGRSVYLASGVGSHFSSDTARCVDRWEIGGGEWAWARARPLRDGRFSREAVEAVGWRGRLCMVNVKGNAAKEGGVYDARKDAWEEMAEGMVAGWRGPAAAMEEEVIYVVDESNGVLSRYDEERDTWVDLLVSERLRGAQQVAAGGGRVCVVCSDGGVAVVDVVSSPARMWVVEPPPGFEAVAVHILYRMSPALPSTP